MMGRSRVQLLRIAVLCCVLLGLAVSGAGAQNGVVVTVAPPIGVFEDSDFFVRLTVDEVVDLDTYQFTLTYDPTVAQVVGEDGGPQGVTPGQIDSTEVPVELWGFVPEDVQGTMTVLGNMPGLSSVSGSGYLCQVNFHVVGSPGNTSGLFISNGRLGNTTPVEIPSTWVDGSVQVVEAVVLGAVDLQGRPAPPGPAWVMPVTLTLYEAGTDTVVDVYNLGTTDQGIVRMAFDQPLGTYDVGVKGLSTLSVLLAGAEISAGINNLDFGTLPAGDANDDDYVGGADYSLLYANYGTAVPPGLAECDFNGDGYVGGADYSLLYTNYGQVGEVPD